MTEPQHLHYTVIETTGSGGSAFSDAEIPLTDRTFAPGVPAMATAGMFAGAGTAYLRSAGFDSAPHPAPARQWVIMLRGTIEVTTSDGDRRQFAPGDLVLAADTSGHGHTTLAVGEAPFEALFIPAEQ